jgi:hypothetical protein
MTGEDRRFRQVRVIWAVPGQPHMNHKLPLLLAHLNFAVDNDASNQKIFVLTLWRGRIQVAHVDVLMAVVKPLVRFPTCPMGKKYMAGHVGVKGVF